MTVPVGDDRLELAVEEPLHPADRQNLVIEDRAEPRLRQDDRQMAVHPAVRTVEPEAEGHDDAALQGSQHPAGDGPPPIPDPSHLLLVIRKVHVPWQRRSERAQGVGDLPFEVVQDQPGAFRNRRRLELVVEGLDVAREERRGFGQSLQQVIDGGHLLVEAEGERLGGFQGTASDRAPLLSGAREQQGRGDDACCNGDGHEGQGDPPPQTERLAREGSRNNHRDGAIAHEAISGRKGDATGKGSRRDPHSITYGKPRVRSLSTGIDMDAQARRPPSSGDGVSRAIIRVCLHRFQEIPE